jgi:hypothetical protein
VALNLPFPYPRFASSRALGKGAYYKEKIWYIPPYQSDSTFSHRPQVGTRPKEEHEVNMFGYVPRQLGHGMGTKFLKEVPDNCILTTPTAVEKGGKY